MILVDLNQVLLAGLMAQIAGQKNITYEEDLIRHMALNVLRNHIKVFKSEYGEVVLCCDNKQYWRKQIFPLYKGHRRKAREASVLDWNIIFDILGKLREELKQYFPYKVLDVELAEADDIIGTLVPRHIMTENIVIISSDSDFIQLQKYNNKNSKFTVKQYNPVTKKFIKSDNPMLDLKEKIIRGDKGDGIANIFSPADSIVMGTRQKPITAKLLSSLLNEDWQTWTDENAKIGYSRNQLLINLDLIPGDVKNRIIETYDNTKPAMKSKLLTYFIEKKLKNLMDVIEDF